MEDSVEGDTTDTFRVDLPIVLGKVRLDVGRPVLTKILSTPDLRVVIGNDTSGDRGVGGGWAPRIVAKSDDLGGRGWKRQL